MPTGKRLHHQGRGLGRPGRTAVAGLCLAVTAALLTSCSAALGTDAEDSAKASSAGSSEADGGKPNIVHVQTDDLSWNLVRYMPHVQQMQKKGVTFSNFFVTDSLCCPSRSTGLTGQYPHNTGVFTNNGNDGGYGAFNKKGNEKKCFAPALQDAGYRTGFMGKYLNGYQPADENGTSKPYVPPGWDEWDVAGNGYPEFDYDLNENGRVKHYGHEPQDYLTDVMAKKASSFVDSSAKAKKPFMLQLTPFAPHSPSTPAPRDRDEYPSLKAPRTEAYDKAPKPAPDWQKDVKPLTAKEKKQIDRKFAKRVRSVQAVDKMIGDLQDQLKEKGLADDTYFVFGSDNGFHMGEHRLRPGKQTAYDTDVNVPLMVTGPAVPSGERVSELTENTDLNPTFLDLAGVKPPPSVDGSSLAELLRGKPGEDWRESVLVEHHNAKSKKGDPDAAPRKNHGDPPSYEALRTSDSLYVEYAGGDREFYSMKSDPEQLRNRISSLPDDRRDELHDTLHDLKSCDGSDSCRKASRVGE
ncbi:sulfatase [Streptomyces sp. HNM0575]|uniref:sulfatase family protein n=1 Tax=Streptomyces sp. HNM0575 TaxID=2716338 RepID=UPI00145C5B44|nr:sulfatase [Streptomyces sp. HNM0575]NLU71919.1 sulfatase [Streptomyces sp. HNM0575]